MASIPHLALEHRLAIDWSSDTSFYSDNFPDILYRVESSGTEHKFEDTTGFRSGTVHPQGSGDTLHKVVVTHCLGWHAERRLPSPFISLSCSFGYAVWEAVRRHWMGHSDITVYLVDGRRLKEGRVMRQHIIHALDALAECEAHCARACKKARKLAGGFDELLVLGQIPANLALGSLTLDSLVNNLPDYFFACRHAESIHSDDVECFVAGFGQHQSFRDAYHSLAENLSRSPQNLDTVSHSQTCVDMAITACMSRPSILDADNVQRCAIAFASWLLQWDEMDNGTVKLCGTCTNTPGECLKTCITARVGQLVRGQDNSVDGEDGTSEYSTASGSSRVTSASGLNNETYRLLLSMNDAIEATRQAAAKLAINTTSQIDEWRAQVAMLKTESHGPADESDADLTDLGDNDGDKWSFSDSDAEDHS